jgi:DNA-binding MarR family transcriptional regulator
MATSSDVGDIANALRLSVGLLTRRARQAQVDGDLSWPERSALARLDRDGPSTSGALAKREQIRPQSMGATLAALEGRGLVRRAVDPVDRRRVVLSLTPAGVEAVRSRRSARTELFARALADGFTADERRVLAAAAPLLERLAQHL